MKLVKISLILCLVLGLLISNTSSLAYNSEPQKTNLNQPAVSNRVLVKFRDRMDRGIEKRINDRINERYQCSQVDQIPSLGVSVIEVPNGMMSSVLKSYRNERCVEYAEPDSIMNAFESTNDPYISNQWALSKTEAPIAWGNGRGSSTIRIAIVDSGIDQNHADLQQKIVSNKNFTSSRYVDDKFGHGTHVAGIAAAITNNKIGIAGSGYGCSLMNVKVLDDQGRGYTSWIIKGITWAADNGAEVINLSLGSPDPSPALEDAVNYAWSKGAVIVAASGNDGKQTLNYPAAYSKCIAVAATDKNDNKANFSTYGNWVDVAAPGVAILSTLPNHSYKINRGYPRNYGYCSGTSMASPLVAGLAGLIWSSDNNTNNEAIRSRIEDYADKPTDGNIYSRYGIPRINFNRSVID